MNKIMKFNLTMLFALIMCLSLVTADANILGETKVVDLTVSGNTDLNLDATNITSGTLDFARLPSTATPSDGDTTHLSTAHQIWTWVASLNFWSSISDVPINIPTNGDTENLSTSDQIYDFIVGQNYTDTQDLSYNESTDVISLTDGGSIDISEVDTNTQLSDSDILAFGYNHTADIQAWVNANDNDTQDLSYNETTNVISLVGGGSINISGIDTDTDTQLSDADILAFGYNHTADIQAWVNANDDVGADTQDLSYNETTNVISLVDGGSIDISEVDTDTNTQLSDSDILAFGYNHTADIQAWVNANDDVGADTQDLSYNETTNVISLVDGGSINISSVDTDTDTQLLDADILAFGYNHTADIQAWVNANDDDTQDLSYNETTNVISLVDGGSINISGIDTDTNTQLSDADILAFGYNHTADIQTWVNANDGLGLENVVEDITPELGGNLVGNGLNLTNISDAWISNFHSPMTFHGESVFTDGINVSYTGTVWEYQEAADSTSYHGTSSENADDGNWSSYVGSPEYMELNFTFNKPVGTSPYSFITVKDQNSTKNLDFSSFPNCWSQSSILFSLRTDTDGTRFNYSCYNGTDWELMYYDSSAWNFYEIAMNWSVESSGNSMVLESDGDVLLPQLTSADKLYTDSDGKMIVGTDANTQLSDSDISAFGYNHTADIQAWVNTNDDVGADTQDLSYNETTNVISLVDGGSINISSVDTDTDTQLSDLDILAFGYNHTANIQAWVNANDGLGLENVVEDTTPELGGNLAGNGNNITDVDYIFASNYGNSPMTFHGESVFTDGVNVTSPACYGCEWTAKASIQDWMDIAVSFDGTIQTAIGYDRKIYVSNDTGNDWTEKDTWRYWQKIDMSSDGQYQSAITNADNGGGYIYISNNSGNTWITKELKRFWKGIAVSSDGSRQTAVADSDYIYVSIDSGNTWTAKGLNESWQDVAMSSNGVIQTAVIYGGQIYISTDSGNTWTPKDEARNWSRIAMSSDGTRQTAVADSDYIYVSTDSGNTWTAKDEARNWKSVAVSSDGIIQIAVANNDYIYVSIDSGNTWTQKGESKKWYGIAISSDGTIQAAVALTDYIYTSIASEGLPLRIDGSDTYLSELPSYAVLGTDANGKIIAGTDANTEYTVDHTMTLTGTEMGANMSFMNDTIDARDSQGLWTNESGTATYDGNANITGNLTVEEQMTVGSGTPSFKIKPNSTHVVFNSLLGNPFLFFGGNVTIPELASCDTIDTDSNGLMSCGTDANTQLSDADILAFGYNHTADIQAWVNVNDGLGLENVVEDTTPELGGNLDVNGKKILGGNIAIGDLSVATGTSAIAIGYASNASGYYSLALGGIDDMGTQYSSSSGIGSVSIGSNAEAIGDNAFAIGFRTFASGFSAVAIGESTKSSGMNALAVGEDIEAGGRNAVAIALNDQNGANCSQDNSMCIMGGKVGIGDLTPDTELDVVGTITTTNINVAGTSYLSDDITIDGSALLQLQANTTAVVCNTSNAGSIYYNGGDFKFYGCNSTDWVAMI